METPESPYVDDEERAKLIPEWRVGADDQIVVGGLAVLLALAGLFVWNAWRSDDGELATVASSIVSAPAAAVDGPRVAAPGPGVELATPITVATSPTTTESAAVATAPSTAADASITAAVEASAGDVQAAVDGLAGSVDGSVDGSVAILEGFVANDAERIEAEAAAAAVAGVERVDNRLVVVEPAVAGVLTEAGVVDATVTGVGTAVTVGGTIQSEADRQPVLDRCPCGRRGVER